MRILVTGANGFAGQHLIRHLLQVESDAAIYGTVYHADPATLPDHVSYHAIDLTDEADTTALIADIKPDIIFHLAAQASAAVSFKQPWQTLETNIRAQFNVFEACIHADIRPRIIITSSAEIYGIIDEAHIPITEDHPLQPNSPYSLSKATQDLMGYQYHIAYQLPVIRVRAFNHIGPGQSANFVAPAFAMQIAKIEAGLQEPILRVGNLNAQRDFIDVRDVVRAYHLLAQQGNAGQAYNVASNHPYSIRELLDVLLSLTTVEINEEVDPDRLRPSDTPIIQGDYGRLHNETGWQPEISIQDSLRDVLNDCRARIKTTQLGD